MGVAAAMGFEEMLRQVHGLVGRRVDVEVAGLGDAAVSFSMSGTIGWADVVPPFREGDGDTLLVGLPDPEAGGFWLHEDGFEGASWDGPRRFELRWRSVVVVLELAAE